MQYLNPYIKLCLEGSSSVFEGISQKEKETVAQHHTIAIIKKGEYLFTEGDKKRGLVYLASGKVKLFKPGVGGREQILKMFRSQGIIGFQILLE